MSTPAVERRMPLARGIYNPESRLNIGRSMFRESVETEYPTSNAGTVGAEVKVFVSGSHAKDTRVSASAYDVDIAVAIRHRVEQTEKERVKQAFLELADKLCEQHPAISTDSAIFGGVPHIKGVRLTVGDILAKLYVYGNIQEILDTYSPDVSEEQIKEAIAYAQDFLETACDPDEASEVDD